MGRKPVQQPRFSLLEKLKVFGYVQVEAQSLAVADSHGDTQLASLAQVLGEAAVAQFGFEGQFGRDQDAVGTAVPPGGARTMLRPWPADRIMLVMSADLMKGKSPGRYMAP